MASRLIQPLQATVDATGKATFLFNPPPAGSINTGTLNVYDSPSTAVWTISIGGVPLITTFGSSPIDRLQQFANETLAVTATGLIPGNVYHAAFTGVTDTVANTQIVYPTSLAQNLNVTGGTINISAGSVSVDGNVDVVLPQEKILSTQAWTSGTSFNVVIPVGIESLRIKLVSLVSDASDGVIHRLQVSSNEDIRTILYQNLSAGNNEILNPVWADTVSDTTETITILELDGATGVSGTVEVIGYSFPANMARPEPRAYWLPLEDNFPSTSIGITLTAASKKVVGSPQAGMERLVDSMAMQSVLANDTISLGINKAVDGSYVFAVPAASVMPVPVNWKVPYLGAGIFALNGTAARGFFFLSYRDRFTNPL